MKVLNEHESWRGIYGKRNSRLKDQELILRFLALFFDGANYQRPMNEFLNKFSKKYKRADQAFLSQAAKVFKGTIDFSLKLSDARLSAQYRVSTPHF